MISNNLPPTTDQIHLRVAKFYNKIENSNNNLLTYIYRKCNNVSIMSRNLSFLYKIHDVTSLYVLSRAIVGSRGMASVDDICTVSAIQYLRNDALLKMRPHHFCTVYIVIDMYMYVSM